MLASEMTDVTRILQAAGRGDRSAPNDLLPLDYDEWRKIPAVQMARQSPGQTLQPTDHDFSGPKLGVQWEWNYQPRADKWSLVERPGFLRLHAFKPLQRENLKKAGNTLTQRVFRTRTNIVTLTLDLSGMADGQVAGLCHYSKDYSTIAARCQNGIISLESAHGQTIITGPKLAFHRVWLRSTWGLDGKSDYSYSTNATVFTRFGETFQLGWGDYRGDRIGIFTYNNDANAGYVDCDSFTYHYDSPTSGRSEGVSALAR